MRSHGQTHGNMYGSSAGGSPRSLERSGRSHRTQNPGINTSSSYAPVHNQSDMLGDEKALEKLATRHFTDLCCCCLWIAWVVLLIIVTCHSLQKGDPRRLYHGFDYKGQLCGVDEAVIDAPYLYWPNAAKHKYPVCMAKCPDSEVDTVVYPIENVTFEQRPDQSVVSTIVMQEILVNTYPTVKVAGRLCMPTAHYGVFSSLADNLESEELANMAEEAMDIRSDILDAWPLYLGLFVVTIILGYVYIFLLKSLASTLTWGVFAILIIGCGTVAIYLLLFAGRDEASAEDFLAAWHLREAWEQMHKSPQDAVPNFDACMWVRAVGWGFLVLTLMLLVWMACFCLSIQRALAVLEASCEAMEDISGLLFMPLIEVFLKLVFVIIWFCLFSWVVTNGEIVYPNAEVNGQTVHGLVKHFQYTDDSRLGIFVYVVELVWGMERITTLFQFLFGFAVATWYYTPCTLDETNVAYGHEDEHVMKQHVSAIVWGRGCCYAMAFHHGSIALASMIVAVFRLFRTFLQAVARQSQTSGNHVAEAMASSCMACIWCFEEIVRFMNKNAVIEMVLNSTDFFTSAGAAVRRLAKAAPEVAALNGITSLFQVIGVMLIGGVGTAIALLATTSLTFFADPASDWYVHHRTPVILVCAFISYGVGASFMFVFDMVSDSMLFCWLVDQEDGKTEYAPKALRKVLAVSKGAHYGAGADHGHDYHAGHSRDNYHGGHSRDDYHGRGGGAFGVN